MDGNQGTNDSGDCGWFLNFLKIERIHWQTNDICSFLKKKDGEYQLDNLSPLIGILVKSLGLVLLDAYCVS